MANVPLKSITFPGLSDTYTIPQIDDTLATAGKAADAKVTGDQLSDLKGKMGAEQSTISTTEQAPYTGYWARNATSGIVASTDTSSTYRTLEHPIDISALTPGAKVTVLATLNTAAGAFITDANYYSVEYVNGNNATEKGYTAGSAPQFVTLTVPKNAKYIMADINGGYYTGLSDFDVAVYDDSIIDLRNKFNDADSDISVNTDNIDYLMDTVNGESVHLYTSDYTVGRLTNGVPDVSAKNRVFTTNILTYPYDIVLSVDTGYRMGVAYYDNNGDPTSAEPWNTTTLKITAGTHFRVMIANSPTDASSTITDVTPYVNAIHCTTNIQRLEDEIHGLEDKVGTVKKSTSYSNRLFYAVAHRGYSNTARPYGDSRLSSYKAAFEAGFNAAECDVQWAGDGTPVCSHDPTFTSNGETVEIEDHTVAELKEYDYFGETIATFEEVLQACKLYGLVLSIDKVSSEWTEANWTEIFGIIKRNQMMDGVWWACPDDTIGAKILAYDKYATLMLTGTSGSISSRITRANALVTDYNTIIIATDYTGMAVNDFILISGQITRRNIWIGAYVINDADDYMDFMPYVKTITSDKYAPTMLFQTVV